MRIRVEKEKCTGCRLCEMVCSLFHTGSINTNKSAIRVERNDTDTGMNVPIVCRQCKEMKCLETEEADSRRERKNFLWERTRAERCPFHAVSVFGQNAYHCDLCGGNPRCLKACTTAALHL